MVAIGLTCAVYFACLVASGLLAFPLRSVRVQGYGDARRTLFAIQRAAGSGFMRSLRAQVVVVGALILTWAIANAIVLPNGTVRSSATHLAYSVLSGLAGAGVASLLAMGTIRWARSAALRALVAAHITTDRLLLTTLRSSLLVSLGVEALGFGVCLSILGIAWISQTGDNATAVVSNTLGILTSFTVGALLASYVMQSSGATYQTAAAMGSATACKDGDLGDTDPRNPSSIAEAAGVQLGQLVPQTLDAFCSALCANLLVALLWNLVSTSSSHSAPDATYLLIPVLMRAFAALALVFALGAARTLETVNPIGALLRAQAIATVISIGAIWGSCYWLMPEISVRLGLCGTLGLILPIGIGHWQKWILNRNLRPNSSPRLANDNPWNTGLFLGMVMVLGPLLALGALFGIAQNIGASLPIAHGRVLVVAVGLLAMNMTVPIATSAHVAKSTIFLARRAIFLLYRRRDDNARRRLTRLDESTQDGSSWATSIQSSYGSAIPLLAGSVFGNWAKDSRGLTFGVEALAAAVACCVALLLPFALRLRLSARASQAVSAEVRRQLNAARQEPSHTAVPASFTPSYRNCVDIAARESTRQMFVSAAATSVPGVMLGLGLLWVTKNPGLVGQALAMYLGQAAIATLVAGVVLEIVLEFVGVARTRTSRLSTMPDLATGNCAIQYLAASSSSAASLLAKTSVIAAITFAPYLF